jgi:hypothetical protein
MHLAKATLGVGEIPLGSQAQIMATRQSCSAPSASIMGLEVEQED